MAFPALVQTAAAKSTCKDFMDIQNLIGQRTIKKKTGIFDHYDDHCIQKLDCSTTFISEMINLHY